MEAGDPRLREAVDATRDYSRPGSRSARYCRYSITSRLHGTIPFHAHPMFFV